MGCGTGTWPIHLEELQLLKVWFILIQSRIYPFNLYATSNLAQLLNESPPFFPFIKPWWQVQLSLISQLYKKQDANSLLIQPTASTNPLSAKITVYIEITNFNAQHMQILKVTSGMCALTNRPIWKKRRKNFNLPWKWAGFKSNQVILLFFFCKRDCFFQLFETARPYSFRVREVSPVHFPRYILYEVNMMM